MINIVHADVLFSTVSWLKHVRDSRWKCISVLAAGIVHNLPPSPEAKRGSETGKYSAGSTRRIHLSSQWCELLPLEETIWQKWPRFTTRNESETEMNKPGIDFIDCVELSKSLLMGIWENGKCDWTSTSTESVYLQPDWKSA